MKANAPEKVYLHLTTGNHLLNGTYYKHKPAKIRFDDKIIEYTRTDAFIEKACEWLRTHSENDYFELIPDANYCGAGTLNKKRMVEDFRNYMKRE